MLADERFIRRKSAATNLKAAATAIKAMRLLLLLLLRILCMCVHNETARKALACVPATA